MLKPQTPTPPTPDNANRDKGRQTPLTAAGAAAANGWRWVEMVLRPILALLGVVLIIAGVPIAIATPLIPVGLPITILGVVLLARNSMAGRRWMQRTLKRHPRLERFAPDWLLRLILGKDSGV